jgi:hypothetical protein
VTHSALNDQEGTAGEKESKDQHGWSPEGEMARMLDLCETQMDAAVRDSDQAVDALVKAFTELVVTARSLNEISKDLAGSTKHQSLAKDLDQRSAALTHQIGAAIVAFQFYDKLTQRMGHVRYSLSTLAAFVCSESCRSPEHWQKLMNTLRRLYRTEEERVIFESVIEGKPALDAAQSPSQGAVHVDTSIELF